MLKLDQRYWSYGVERCSTTPRCSAIADTIAGLFPQNSSTYWEGNCEAESLQRVYGISFPDNKQLKEWKHFQEEAAKRDHRKLGKVPHTHNWNPYMIKFDLSIITLYHQSLLYY